MLPWVLCGVLAAIVLLPAGKIILLKKGIGEVCTAFRERLAMDTNTLISVSVNDKQIKKIAAEINGGLKELRRERRKLQNGDRELKEAITNISHDIRTPLTAIGGYLDLLDNAPKSKATKRYIEIIKNRAEVLRQLTEELFRYSVVTSPEYDISTEVTNVNRVLEESILGFYAALSRIFSNLLSNANKYSDGDLRITFTDAGKIIFSNTASGLSEIEVQRLFDRFYTVETAKKSTGLGLSISKVLVEQMKGGISAKYEDKILSVIVTLPKQK